MFYYRYSATRIFFINEYWILIPAAVLANYFIIRKMRSNRAAKRARLKELKRLIDLIEREQRIRKILLVSLGLSVGGYTHLLTRGGEADFLNLIDTEYIRSVCEIEEGIRYLDDPRLRKIITQLYRHKRKAKIIYVTATAVCHLANRYGQMFFALPVAIGDFGFTSLYQSFRKVLATIILGGIGPLYFKGTPVALFFAFILGASGLNLALTNLDIATSAVDVTKVLKPRIPGTTDVVVMNNVHKQNKIIMCDPAKENHECWLPDQRLFNPNCKVKLTEMPDVVDPVLSDLKYEDTVNMRDVTGLNQQTFTDIFDLKQTEPSICKPRQGKEVNFLEKFGGSGQISESETWDIDDNEFMVPEQRDIRTRN